MDPLQLRESEVLNTLKKLEKFRFRFVLIGGYSVNTYTLPRFSVDCDIVIKSPADLGRIEGALLALGYEREVTKFDETDFARYTKGISGPFKVSVDIMIGEVSGRKGEKPVSAEWVFSNSKIRALKGKTIRDEVRIGIINLDALVAMKTISCRQTDIRDVFMLAPYITDRAWVKAEVSSRCDFGERLKKIKETITSKDFRNGLQGVYGIVEASAFEKSAKAIDLLGE